MVAGYETEMGFVRVAGRKAEQMPAATQPVLHFDCGGKYTLTVTEVRPRVNGVGAIVRVFPWGLDVHDLFRRVEARDLRPSYERSKVTFAPPSAVLVDVVFAPEQSGAVAILEACRKIVDAIDGR